jgi:hypothetical protein
MVRVQTHSIRAALVALAGLALPTAATELPLLPFPFELRATDDLPGRPVQPVLGELDTLYALESVALTGLAHPALEDARIELVRVRVATKAAAFFVDSQLVHLLAGPAQDGDWSQSVGRLVTEAEMQLVDVRPSQYCQLYDLPARTGSRTETRNPVAPFAPPATVWKQEALGPQYGGHLVAITSAALESWLDAQFLASGTLSGDVYIGATDGESEGTFGWISGAAWSYDNWASGQPNDFNGGQDYTDWRDGIEWTDVEGFDLLPAIVQRPQ